MKCSYCNREIVDDAIFCSYCGKRVLIKKPGMEKKYYNCIKEYFQEICPKDIDVTKYFNPSKKTDMKDIFYQYCLDLQDYNMMPGVIGFMRVDRKELFSEILFDYDKNMVSQTYTVDTLYEKFCNTFPVKNRESRQNLWMRYSKSIIDSCNYLSQFSSAEDFNAYIESFHGDFSVLKTMSKSITGMGFALACNIIKDLGFTDYAKPDTHTMDVIEAMGYERDEMAVINAIREIASINNDTPFNLDRMIWLICTGNFFEDNVLYGIHKKELISKINEIKGQ